MVMEVGDESVSIFDAALAHSKSSYKAAWKQQRLVAQGRTVHTEEYCMRKKCYIHNFIEELRKEVPKWNVFLKLSKDVLDIFHLKEDGTLEGVFI